MRNKAVSEMIAYVLLIVIAISVSAIVYAVLRAYVPTPAEKCPDDVSIMIQDYACADGVLNLTVRNQGLHSVDGMYVHISNQSGKPAAFPLEETSGTGMPGEILFPVKLNASEARIFHFDYSEYNAITKINIKPFKSGKTIVLCDAVTAQDISCGVPLPSLPSGGCTVAKNCTAWVNRTCDACDYGKRNQTRTCDVGCNYPTSQCVTVLGVCGALVLTMPVSWWKFDESSGTSCADSKDGYDLTTVGGPGFVPGKMGNALEVTNPIGLNTKYAKNSTPITNLRFTGNFTLEALVNLTTMPTVANAYIIREGSASELNYGLKIDSAGQVNLLYANTAVLAIIITPCNLASGAWYHLVAVKNGTDFKLYINNVTCKRGTFYGTAIYSSNDLQVGMIENGLTDEVAIYNHSLSAEEISVHYNNVFNRNESYYAT